MADQVLEYSAFRAFKIHFEALGRGGFYKLFLNSPSPAKIRIHHCYRAFICWLVVTYNIQHLIKLIQVRNNTDEMLDTLSILLTTVNALVKHIIVNMRMRRMDKIIEVLNGFHFSPKVPKHVEILKRNEIAMRNLLYFFHLSAVSGSILYLLYPIVTRALGHDVQMAAYFPFDTSETSIFVLANVYLTINISFQAYGNSTMDCMISTFFCTTKTQLQMLKYNLENIVNLDDNSEATEYSPYLDSDLIQRRLRLCVQHHLQILWFHREVESIFCEIFSLQFLVTIGVLCVTVYGVVNITVASLAVCFKVVYLVCMLEQLFIYCYYGTQLQYESEDLVQSIYFAEWIKLSPEFRRKVILLMITCSRPIVPTAAKIVPVSLETFIAVLKASYTMFTILDKQ